MEKPVFNGKYKALTFSFDDGNFDDIRLIKIMNKYGLKGTFNLNSGKITKADHWVFADDKDVCTAFAIRLRNRNLGVARILISLI